MEQIGDLGHVAVAFSDESFGFVDLQSVVVFDDAAFSVLGEKLFYGAFALAYGGSDVSYGQFTIDIFLQNVQNFLYRIGNVNAIDQIATSLVLANYRGISGQPD